jgi:predicted AlkP superfamily pyrophosphatase or phosphodiesterase
MAGERALSVGLALAVALLVIAAPAPSFAAEDGTVIVLSWDGMRHDYPDRGEFPGLARVISEGARAERLVTVFPSSTFPGHVSLATGTHPDRHGIVGNHFVDRQLGRYAMESEADWLLAEPIWIAAERQGVIAATYFWVGSESDWRGRGTRYRESPFDGGRPEAVKVDRILEWLALPEGERPRLIMSYWAGADRIGHRFGPESARVTDQIAAQDLQLQRLLQGLDLLDRWASTTLLIVSDHGMAESHRYTDLRGMLATAGIGARVTGSTVAHVYLDDPDDHARAGDLLGKIEGARVYSGDALPGWMRLSHAARTGDWLVVASPPLTFSRPAGWEGAMVATLSMAGWTFGSHGYPPDHPDMPGMFLALGRGVPAGARLPAVHQVDVAATIAALLGIEPPLESEGTPVPGLEIPVAAHEAAKEDDGG